MVSWKNILLAAGIKIPQSADGGSNALVGQSGSAETPIPEAHAVEDSRPWYFDRISSTFVNAAVSNRQPNFPESSASSVAARVVNAALAQPQATKLLSAAASVLMRNDRDIPPSQVRYLVDMASSAYNEMRTSPGFNDYTHYIASNAKNFKIPKNDPGPHGPKIAGALQHQLSKLGQSPAGREAISAGERLYQEVMKDAGFIERPNPGHRRVPNSAEKF